MLVYTDWIKIKCTVLPLRVVSEHVSTSASMESPVQVARESYVEGSRKVCDEGLKLAQKPKLATNRFDFAGGKLSDNPWTKLNFFDLSFLPDQQRFRHRPADFAQTVSECQWELHI